jgi:hypothetical protein
MEWGSYIRFTRIAVCLSLPRKMVELGLVLELGLKNQERLQEI